MKKRRKRKKRKDRSLRFLKVKIVHTHSGSHVRRLRNRGKMRQVPASERSVSRLIA